jgi:hypothetical protein
MPLAEHLDDLQMILGERLRTKLGINLWQHLREGGNLKVATETRQGTFNTTYAFVAGYRLVDPSRKKLVPTLQTALRVFEKIGPPAAVISAKLHLGILALACDWRATYFMILQTCANWFRSRRLRQFAIGRCSPTPPRRSICGVRTI